jgi:hypothetical protein
MRSPFHLLIMVALFLSCRKENAFDCFKGNGSEITQVRQPGAFRVVAIYDKMEVLITQGPECRVEVTAGEKIMRNISTGLSHDTLKIINRNTCNFVRGYKKTIRVKIVLPYAKNVINYSVGPVTFEQGFTQDTLVVKAESSGDFHINGTFDQLHSSSSGNGDMYLSGKCNSLHAFSYGTNFLYARDLSIKNYAFIHNVSYGDSHVNASGLNELAYNIARDGNIYYTGDPAIISDHGDGTGRGKLIREE